MKMKVSNLTKIHCPLCDSLDYTIVLVGKDMLMNNEGEFDLVRCDSCGLTYLNPQPSEENLNIYYSGSYSANSVDNLREIITPGSFKAKVFRLMYFNLYEHIAVELNKFKKLQKDIKLLDVGCGNGGFLYFMKESEGVKGHGVEMSKNAAEFATNEIGVTVFNNTFLKAEVVDKYDIVTAFHYFEHELYPNEVLQKLHKIVKKDGVLLLELPNVNSIGFKLFGKYWPSLDIPRHVFHYTPETLTKILNKNGFEVKKIVKYPRVSFVDSVANRFGFGIKIRELGKLPLIFKIPLYHLPRYFFDNSISYILRIFFDTDVMAVYATLKED